jgi:hypothetical protein
MDKLIDELIEIFGQEDASKIFTTLQNFVDQYTELNGPKFPISLYDIIDIIVKYTKNEKTITLNHGKSNYIAKAGQIAYDSFMRIYYIKLIFSDKNLAIRLFNIMTKNSLKYRKISKIFDRFLDLLRKEVDMPPANISHMANMLRVSAQHEAQARLEAAHKMQQTTETFGDRVGRPAALDEHVDEERDEFGNVDNPLREAILDIESIMRLDLTDPDIRSSIFPKLIELFPSIQQEEFNEEIEQLIKERKGLPPSPDFPIGLFTPNQQKRLEEAIQLGWQYGKYQGRPAPEFFRRPDGSAPGGSAAAGRGGNKKTKSKKITKRCCKSKRCSKRRSIRRRRRNSYKK